MGIPKDSNFLKDWRKQQRKILQQKYPNISKKEINKFLDDLIEERLVNRKAEIHNNYIHKSIHTNLLEVIDWVETTNPICAGYGVFYKSQEYIKNPLATMINGFLISRKKFKGQLKFVADKTSFEYATLDRQQLSEKVVANSIYGCSGNRASFMFNLYVAPSITASGQSLISTTEQAFEAFMTNSVLFNDLNECLTFIRNIQEEKYEMESFIPRVSIKKVYNRLVSMFHDWDDRYSTFIWDYLVTLDPDMLTKIYYKNNIYEFSMIYEIKSRLTHLCSKVDSFLDPNSPPDIIKGDLDELWSYYEKYVFYNYSPINRIQRLKFEKRRSVLTIDTDSNMINLHPWVEFMEDNIYIDDEFTGRDGDDLWFISINVMAYLISKMIKGVLSKYTDRVNIPKDFQHYINMKNEFLFSVMVLADVKKRYITSVRLREGDMIYPEKLDIKGYDFEKSVTSEFVRKYFRDIIVHNIIEPEKPNIRNILRELRALEKEVTESLERGEKTYLTPVSVKEEEGYSETVKGGALSQQGFRAVCVWNHIEPDMMMELPTKTDIVKLKVNSLDDLRDLQATNPEIYNRIAKKIYGSKNEYLAEKGIGVIAIPRTLDTIPSWIIPYIDTDTIANDIVKKFYSVIESLGIETVSGSGASGRKYLSNIINIG